MTKPKILILGKVEFATAELEALYDLADPVRPKSTNRADFLSESHSGAFDGCVASFRTFASLSITGPVDAELISALPPSLRFLSHNGAGYDSVDTAACAARSPPLLLSNVPAAVDDSTADAAAFLILGALRNFNTAMCAARRGQWRGDPAPDYGRDPRGKVLGVLGLGGIGRNLGAKMAAFGMRTVYHNRKRLGRDEEAGAEYVSFDELLAVSDVLSLNLPLNDRTHHIVSHAEFAKMKPDVIIINTARGAVMDEAALVAALDAGKVGSAGLDVFEDEPNIHPGLVANDRVVLLPHMGTWSVETLTEMERCTLRNVRSAVEEGRLLNCVAELRHLQGGRGSDGTQQSVDADA